MTKEEAIQKVISVANAQIGYHEGSNNQNKFAEDSRVIQALGWNADCQPWCVIFVVWVFIEAFGLSNACKMLRSSIGSVSAAVQGLASNFQAVGATTTTPTAGCPVCYSGMGHIGICVGTSPLTCTDGNYSDSVRNHWNPSSDAVLYLIPDWNVVANESSEGEAEEKKEKEATETFSAGDIVSIKSGATYYNGGSIPSKYLAHKWIIMQVFNDRAVLNKSADGEITGWMSPVNVTYLTKDGTAAQTAFTNTASSATTSTSATSTGVWGVVSAMAEKIKNSTNTGTENSPVILNNTATATHTYGGKITNIN